MLLDCVQHLPSSVEGGALGKHIRKNRAGKEVDAIRLSFNSCCMPYRSGKIIRIAWLGA